MKTKKITAVLMAAAMAVSMAATTAMSASAEEIDPTVRVEEMRAIANTTPATINWSNFIANTPYSTNYAAYKLNMSGTSMADGALKKNTTTVLDNCTMKYSSADSAYILTFKTKTLTYLGLSADITDIDAVTYTYDNSGVKNGEVGLTVNNPATDVWEIVIPDTNVTIHPNGSTYDYGLQVTFSTSLDGDWFWSLFPDMVNPTAFLLFTPTTTIA